MLNILQITDTHVFADDSQMMLGCQSNLAFNHVIDRLLENEDGEKIDFIFLTGDISQDETKESYQKVAEQLIGLNKPVYWIPGNHDDEVVMQSAFKAFPSIKRARRLIHSCWDFIFLNTSCAGKTEGYLSQAELVALESELQEISGKNIALVMHHHPSPVGTPFMDQWMLKNYEAFWECVGPFQEKIKLIMCGHVHGDYSLQGPYGIQMEVSPATCFQIGKDTDVLKTIPQSGYKYYRFEEEHFMAEAKLFSHERQT